MELATKITPEIKKELVEYVLTRISVRDFNKGIKEYSVQAMYSKFKRQLKSDYPNLMPTDLRYSVAMSEAFEEYKVPEIECKELERKMSRKRKLAVSRNIPAKRKREHRKEYNEMVDRFNKLIQPQQKLRRLYKKLNKVEL